jgi:hypothetical protein
MASDPEYAKMMLERRKEYDRRHTRKGRLTDFGLLNRLKQTQSSGKTCETESLFLRSQPKMYRKEKIKDSLMRRIP